MHKRDHCSEDTKISKYPKNIIKIHNRLAETISIIKPQAYGGPTCSEAESVTVGINSRIRWQSGCMQGSTRRMDCKRAILQKGIHCPLSLWHDSSPGVTS